MSRRYPNSIPGAWRAAWSLSLALHAVALGASVSMMLRDPNITIEPSVPLILEGRWSPPRNEFSAIELPAPSIAEGLEVESLGDDAKDSRWSQVMERSRERTPLPNPDPSNTSDLSSFVSQRIQRSVRSAEGRTTDENVDRLSQLSRRLRDASSEQGVDDMANFLSGMVGSRRTEPLADTESREFDVRTAQIHRVRIETDTNGTMTYIATMIDSQGVTTEIELDRETGPSLYKTMKLIESNPLLERVYRKIVMGFLDQLLRDSAMPAASTNSEKTGRSPNLPVETR